MLTAVNPFTGKACYTLEGLTESALQDKIDQANQAFSDWKALSYSARAQVLNKVAAQLREGQHQLARLMAEEMGKPVKEGLAEVEKSAWCAEFYAEHAEAFLRDEVLVSDASESRVHYQPLGTVLGILPWNAPAWLAFRFLAPSLMAGNTCLMKHDPNVPASARAIAEAFVKAGAPEGVMVNLPLETERVEGVIRDRRVAAVSFTGSSAAGSRVAAVAGSEIKPCVLELGGSDPCIVFADADLEKAADVAVLSRIINAGQSCIAAKRILIERPIYEEFLEMLRLRLARLKLGDPLLMETDIGPIARKDLQLNLHRQVQSSIAAGARCLLGGELPDGDGFFYPVSLLADVDNSMPAFCEETFGPVAAACAFNDVDHALSLANDTDYGLGAAVWTADKAVADYLAENIVSGQIAINGIVKTDPRLPSGGVKKSGVGRELGPHGIKEFVNAKQIWRA
jgi:succinate-semialdehyde dehydrogenase / glutarate-semialdehyde dehydrogenase